MNKYILLLVLLLVPFATNATGVKYCKKHKCPVPPTATTTPPIATTTPPVATTTPPIATSTPPVATTTTPVATSTLPIATTTPPLSTTTPTLSTSTPVSTTTPSISPIVEPKPLGNGAIWCSGPTAPGWNVSKPNGGCNTNTVPVHHIDPKPIITVTTSTTTPTLTKEALIKRLIELLKLLVLKMQMVEPNAPVNPKG
jgi:hypothetical protein